MWLCTATTSMPFSMRVLMTGSTSFSSMVKSPATAAFSGVPCQAAQVLKPIKVLPSFIMMDMGVPDMDGEVLLKLFMEDQRLRKIPVIIVTADLFIDGKVEA